MKMENLDNEMANGIEHLEYHFIKILRVLSYHNGAICKDYEHDSCVKTLFAQGNSKGSTQANKSKELWQ